MSEPILKIDITANANQLLAAINKAQAKFNELSSKIQSLPTGDKQFNKISRELNRTQNTITQLSNSYNKLGVDVENTAPKLQQIGNASKSARTALTSLSLTIQDLPFGFLGIQNNLPGVIQGFGNLTSTTNGKILPALQEIGKSLIGPAGIFLAFSAVTSIVTLLVQKYGSLGGAIDALLGKQTKFTKQLQDQTKALDDYGKNQKLIEQISNDAIASQSGQIEIIKSFTAKATDLTASQNTQKTALEELKKISQDYYGNLEIGAQNIDKIRSATDKYINTLIAQAKVKAYADEIVEVDKLIKENDRLQKTAEQNVIAAQKQDEINKKLIESSAKLGGAATGLKSNLKDAQTTVETLATKTFDLNNRKQELIDSIKEENDILIPNIQNYQKGAKAVKEYFEAYKPPKAYTDYFKETDLQTRFEEGIDLFNKLKDLDLTQGTNSVKKFNEILNTLKEGFPERFKDIVVTTPKQLLSAFINVKDSLKNELDQISYDLIEKDLIKNVKESIKKIAEEWKKSQKSIFRDYPEPSTENIIGLKPGTYEKVMAPVLKMQEDMKKARENFLRNFQDVSNILNDVFFQPLQDQFLNLINTGKINLKEFGKIVVENLKALAAKILATGIITLLGMIITGGLSNATQLKTGLSGFQLFGKAFASALGFGGTKSANFGGVNPGGLAMSGAVSLSLRGSDLVGAINRTNTNINRIG